MERNLLSEAAALLGRKGGTRRAEVLTAAERHDSAVAAGLARRKQLMKLSKAQRRDLASKAAGARWGRRRSKD